MSRTRLPSLRDGLGRSNMSSPPLVVVFVVVAGLCHLVVAFNVDIHVPIVKEGISGSYFGFSIAQHYVYNRRLGFGDPFILVGAPRDNITDRSAPADVRILVRPGAVYKCPFSSSANDCSAIKVDRESPQEGFDRNDQWFGVSVASQGTSNGQALACAHRYKKTGPSYLWGIGVCISMTNALDEDQYWEPCEDRPKSKGHGEYGLCQAGTSIALDKDGDMLLGAPGPFNWRGAAFKNSITQSASLDEENTVSWLQSPVEDLLPGDEGKPEPATGYYSYLGMSVKIGRLLNGQKTYVVGAPRSKESGQVLLMQAVNTGLVVRQYLSGEQFGSSFGYDMTIVDVNNDNKEDLIVGAPFFHSAGVGGAIYVFLNGPTGIEAGRNQTIHGRKVKDVECAQLDCHNARFGFSLASAGDIDSDGYNDIIVGAPYEGAGAIYIFRGSARGLLVEFSQRIHASNLPSTVRPIRSFGHALSAGMDMDINGYPDIVVGSFGSDKIVILRSRPVINVMSTLVSTPAKINLYQTSGEHRCSDRSMNSTYCFEVEACFQFSAKPVERFRGPINVAYKLEAEKFASTRPSRVTFKGAKNREDGSYVDLEITLQRQGEKECHRHMVFINNNNRDFLNPIKLKLTQRLRDQVPPVMTPGGALPDINLNPILNASLAENQLTVDFLKNCGRDGECVSSLVVKGSLELPMDNVTKDYVLRVGQVREIKLVILVTNTGEEAHEAMVYIDMPPSLEYRGTDERGKQYSCAPGENGTVLCAVGNPMVHNQEAKFTIRLDPGKVTTTAEKLNITIRVTTTSKESNPLDDRTVVRMRAIIEADILVRGISTPEQVMFSGETTGESAMKTEEDIGLEVIHTYEVENLKGSGRVNASSLHISWPYAQQDDQYLLYLVEPPLVKAEVPVKCTYDANKIINPLKLELRPSAGFSTAAITRPSRQSADLRSAVAETDPGRPRREKRESGIFNNPHQTFDCDSPNSAKCHEIVCNIGELGEGDYVVIHLRARVWNSTFLRGYVDFDRVTVSSKAEIRVDPRLNVRQPTGNDIGRATTTIVPDIQVQRPLGLALWIIIVIIIVAIIIGIFLLCLIMLLLWKCGFFKRNKPSDDLAMQKAKLERQSEYNDD